MHETYVQSCSWNTTWRERRKAVSCRRHDVECTVWSSSRCLLVMLFLYFFYVHFTGSAQRLMLFHVKLLYATGDQSEGKKWRWFRCLLKVVALKKAIWDKDELPGLDRKEKAVEGTHELRRCSHMRRKSGGRQRRGRNHRAPEIFIKWNTRSLIMQIMWKIRFINMEIKRKQTLIYCHRFTKQDGRWKHPVQQNVGRTHFNQIRWILGKCV